MNSVNLSKTLALVKLQISSRLINDKCTTDNNNDNALCTSQKASYTKSGKQQIRQNSGITMRLNTIVLK